MMTSRERVKKAIRHEVTDRVPVDLGATAISGIHVSELKRLREELGLETGAIKALDPMTLIAEVTDDVREALEIDCVGLFTGADSLGLTSDTYKEWELSDGTTVLLRDDFSWTKDAETGTIYAYPQGDTSVPPSAFMSSASLYFDNIPRQEDLDKKTEWDARKDYAGMYSVLPDKDLRYLESRAKELYETTDYAIIGSYGGGGLGDIFHVPGPWLKETKGIREVEDWYMAIYLHRDYLMDLFDMQTDITLENMQRYFDAVGNRIEVMVHSGTDFAFQGGSMIAPELYREVYTPFYKKVNDWIHKNTDWKSFMHSCGSVVTLIPEFIDAGFDILNPVQVSAKDMDAVSLKEKFGDSIVFWGGGCDPQFVLPSGTPEEVYAETRRNAQAFSQGGGFVGGNVHNVQYEVPIPNLLAEFRALHDTVPQK
ncbi:uroporphyrinogen decarboxylase family protein [Christensenella tenuis]|jgi:uroporphyrinogen-III decarboxylase|uniref:Methyltransferase n=1 Tax=Christensenella tenuis TaxID=2763033 RepID=A0ABR7EGC1_9FIRM|nr:uroporphyrinogen decarboxylase family protein [Christensenella tenuis]MBC5648815.1 methyltransferase [Christensenella tenuis]